ncbi:MAG: phosphatase PAP2 family protein [Inhella sp.]
MAGLLATARGALLNEPTGGDPAVIHPALDGEPWTQWASSARAQSLLADALSGLRVRAALKPERARIERWSSAANAWVDWVELQRPPESYFVQQLEWVDAQLPLRESRSAEIVAQVSSALPFLLAVAAVPWERRARSLEFLAAALALQQALQQRVKHMLGCARPHHLRPGLMPHVEVPGHASLPSGHAGESHLAAALIGHWIRRRAPRDSRPLMLDRMAMRVAENRVVAGVHFPVDSVAGRLLGQAVFRHLRGLCGDADASPSLARFGLADEALAGKGSWSQQADAQPQDVDGLSRWPLCKLEQSPVAVDVSDDWRRLWQLACEEW